MSLKVNIITAVFNGGQTLEDCLKSIHSQTYPYIEHIIIDGGSADCALDIVKKYRDKVVVLISEPDNGIYDAINKGLKLATGDIIGILNSDDMYANEFVIENVVNAILSSNVDSCYGDLVYVKRDSTDRIVRYWKAGNFHKDRFK